MLDAADNTACIDEPHRRLIVMPGTDSGKPERAVTKRPILYPCSASGYAHPSIKSSKSTASISFLFINPVITWLAKSSGLTERNSPLCARWNGDLAQSTITALIPLPVRRLT